MAQTFNEAELLEQVANDVDFLVETIGMLRTDAPGLVDQIAAALITGDAPMAGRAAHALKGMVSNFCAPAAQAAALDMERAGKAGDLTLAAAAVEPLRRQIEDLIAELDAFVQARS